MSRHCPECGKFVRRDGTCKSCTPETMPLDEAVAEASLAVLEMFESFENQLIIDEVTDKLHQYLLDLNQQKLDRQWNRDLRGLAMSLGHSSSVSRTHAAPYVADVAVFTELSEGQAEVAELWKAHLEEHGMLPAEGDTLKSFGIPDADDPVCTELADARSLLSDAWGCVRNMQERVPHWERERAVRVALLRYLELLSTNVDVTATGQELVDPALDIKLLWAIELAEQAGEFGGKDPDTRQHAVNWKAEWKATGRNHNPEGAEWDEDDNEIDSPPARLDGLISNPQIKAKQGMGKKYFTWALGLKGTWNPNPTRFDWSYYRPVGLMRQTLMSHLRDLADVIKLKAIDGVIEPLPCITLGNKPTSPMKVTIPWGPFIERACMSRPWLQDHWKLAASITNVDEYWAWENAAKLDPKVVAAATAPPGVLISTRDMEDHLISIEEGVYAATPEQNTLTPKQVVRWIIMAESAKAIPAPLQTVLTPKLHQLWVDRVQQTLADREEYLSIIRSLIMLQRGSPKLKLPETFTVSIWGDIVDIYRGAIGSSVGTTSAKAHRKNGRTAVASAEVKGAAARVAAKLRVEPIETATANVAHDMNLMGLLEEHRLDYQAARTPEEKARIADRYRRLRTEYKELHGLE